MAKTAVVKKKSAGFIARRVLLYVVLIIIGVIYFVVTFVMSKLVAVLEKKLKEGD